MNKEYISHEPDDKDAWNCICGNHPFGDGFFPCDEKGIEEKPDEPWPTDLSACNLCGRIIDFKTLEVVGKNDEIAGRYAASLARRS